MLQDQSEDVRAAAAADIRAALVAHAQGDRVPLAGAIWIGDGAKSLIYVRLNQTRFLGAAQFRTQVAASEDREAVEESR
jgi:hypothetical protein